MRTPEGTVVTETGGLGVACLTLTTEAPPAAPGTAATFRTPAETQQSGQLYLLCHLFIYPFYHLEMYLCRYINAPGALPAAPSGLPAMDVLGEGTKVMPDSGTAWLAGVTATGAGLLGELAPTVAVGAGLEAGEVTEGVLGMSYFCSCSR